MSTTSFSHNFAYDTFKGSVKFPTGIFIGGKFHTGSDGTTIDIINPTNAKVLTSIAKGTARDVDRAVSVARKTFETSWGLKVPGAKRGLLLNKLADLMQEHEGELAALETLDNGKTFKSAKEADLAVAIGTIRYFAGWADKIHGQEIETDEKKLVYTRREPFGVVGQIIPWNYPLALMTWKLGPALAAGNCVVFKPSEKTPLSALYMCSLINEAGFPHGVVNVITGYEDVGATISGHMDIDKVVFTGSQSTGRKVMEAAAKSNMKSVMLELGGNSPNIVYNDADLDLAVDWSVHGIFSNQGESCCASSPIFVQSGIYDDFLKRFTQKTNALKLGDPFVEGSYMGPQVSQDVFERVMKYIQSGKDEGATVHLGGRQRGTTGYWIEPTIFVNTKPHMRIVKEEILGPVAVIIKFDSEEEVLRQANDTPSGLAAAVFTKDITRGIQSANQLQVGTTWINCSNSVHWSVPFGGYKQSGIGRECGQEAIYNYTNVKSVHVNLGERPS